ncbi:MAG: glycosyltransferase family 39 protein [Lentisphaeria bacterium]|nr:glycosyltransferase family 39 protein [Lentisphaeria bacterium]
MPNPSLEKWRFLFKRPWIIAAGLGSIIGMLVLGDMPLASDALAYHQEATRMVSGDFRGPFYYPPGMTSYLAAFFFFGGRSLFVSRLAIILTVVLTVCFTEKLTGLLTGDQRLASRAGLIAALYPPVLMLAGQPYSQHVAMLCVLATCFFWLKALKKRTFIYFCLTGLALGVGILTRPSFAAAGLIFAVSGVVTFVSSLAGAGTREKKRLLFLLSGACVTVATLSLVIFPAIRHNIKAGAGPVISTNNERNFLLGNCPHTPLYRTDHLAQRPLKSLPEEVRDYLRKFYGQGFSSPQARKAMRREAFHYIRSNPDHFLLRTLNRIRAFWGFDYLASRRIQVWLGASTVTIAPLLIVEAGGYFLVMFLAIIGLFDGDLWLRKKGDLFFLLGLILCYQLPYCVAFSGGTYHFPVMGLLFPFASLGWGRVASRWRERKWRALLCLPKGVYAVWAVFTIIQIEYAFFTLLT